MESLNDVILSKMPELDGMKVDKRRAVLRHMAPYLNGNRLDNLVLMPLREQREVLAELIVEMAKAKAKCETREDFETSTIEDIEKDVEKEFAAELANVKDDAHRIELKKFIAEHLRPYKFSTLYTDEKLKNISRFVLFQNATSAVQPPTPPPVENAINIPPSDTPPQLPLQNYQAPPLTLPNQSNESNQSNHSNQSNESNQSNNTRPAEPTTLTLSSEISVESRVAEQKTSYEPDWTHPAMLTIGGIVGALVLLFVLYRVIAHFASSNQATPATYAVPVAPVAPISSQPIP